MGSGKKNRLVPWLLVLLPTWLIASACFALVKYFKDEKKTEAEAEKRFSQSVSTPLIADDLRKIVTIIGERNTTPVAASVDCARVSKSRRRAASSSSRSCSLVTPR